jgi:hypothetical protein
MEHLFPLLGFLLILMVMAVVVGRAVLKSRERRLWQHWNTPLERWAGCALSILHYPSSANRLKRDAACRELEEGWGVTSRAELLELMSRLSNQHTGQAAWNLLRLMNLAQLGSSAELLTADTVRKWTKTAVVALQNRYESWDEFAEQYLLHRRQHMGSTAEQRLRQNIGNLKRRFWPKVDYKSSV